MWDHVLHFALLVVALAAFFVVPPLVAIPFFAVMSVVGGVGTVVEWRGGTGLVRHRGELWGAASDSTFEAKTRVRIVRAEGTMLHVRLEGSPAAPVRDRA